MHQIIKNWLEKWHYEYNEVVVNELIDDLKDKPTAQTAYASEVGCVCYKSGVFVGSWCPVHTPK